MDCSRGGTSHECSFNPPMLVAKRYLQMKNIVAVALDTEMAGFDDSRMHGPYRDFVNLGSGYREEISDTGDWCWRQSVARPVGRVKSNRLQPRMPLRMNLPLLGDLTLEPMSLRAFERQARVRLGHFCSEDREATGGRIRQHGDQSNILILCRHPEQRRQRAGAAHRGENRGSELGNREIGNVLKRNCFATVK